MSRFLSPWYVVNALTLAAYIVPRVWFATQPDLSPYARVRHKEELYHMERTMLGVITLSLGFKFMKRESWDGFFQDAFLYPKVLLLYLLWLVDMRICGLFAYWFIVQYGLVQQPLYDGPASYSLPFTPQSFADQVLGAESKQPAKPCLVLFGAPWSPETIAFAPVFAALSRAYARDNLTFGEVDIAAWPQLAKQFKISEHVWSGQIPSLILFEQGKSTLQYPAPPGKSQVQRTALRKKDIIKLFDLEARAAKAGARPHT